MIGFLTRSIDQALSLTGSVGWNVHQQFRCSHLVKFPSYLQDHVNLSCTLYSRALLSLLDYILLGILKHKLGNSEGNLLQRSNRNEIF